MKRLIAVSAVVAVLVAAIAAATAPSDRPSVTFYPRYAPDSAQPFAPTPTDYRLCAEGICY
jgi:hypothetical protein